MRGCGGIARPLVDMVLTVAWTHSWAAVSISLGVLLLLVAFLLACLCCERTPAGDQQYYVLDEAGIKRLPSRGAGAGADAGFFRRLSTAGVLRPNFRFSACRPHLKDCDRDLMDSLDFDKQFSNSVLQIDACDRAAHLDADDWRSCVSGVFTRRNSMESVRSAVSDPGRLKSAADLV